MVLRLSELLERIRPTGAPGGASESEQSREQLTARETADVARALTAYAAEADLVLSRAHKHAQQIREESEQQSRHVRSDLSDRLAAAHVEGAALPTRRRDAELSRIDDEAEREIARLDAQAANRLPAMVDDAMALIWNAVEAENDPGGEP
jgi:cell division septum initiation protein DivIVA